MKAKILLVSASWPTDSKSGVSLIAEYHATLLASSGYEVGIVGSHESVLTLDRTYKSAHHLISSGSGALYSTERYNVSDIVTLLKNKNPDIVIIEAWQTAIAHGFIDAAYEMKVPILVVSHGISIHPFAFSLRELIRAALWIPYAVWRLPKLVSKVSALTALDMTSPSRRFYDRDLAKRLGKAVYYLPNPSINSVEMVLPIETREATILVVGYYSRVKNQIGAIRAFKLLRELGCLCRLKFIGRREGKYFRDCTELAKVLGVNSEIEYLQDNEIGIQDELSKTSALFMPSLTEALPVVLLEAMSMGTPFVATGVGAVLTLQGGIVANNLSEQVHALMQLFTEQDLWQKHSLEGRKQYMRDFSKNVVKEKFLEIVEGVSGKYK